jgi:hypothetical protein
MTPAERSAAYRARRKAAGVTDKPVIVRYRKPADRRSRPERWTSAVQVLSDILAVYETWTVPAGLGDSPMAQKLTALLELRSHIDDLEGGGVAEGIRSRLIFSMARARTAESCVHPVLWPDYRKRF